MINDTDHTNTCQQWPQWQLMGFRFIAVFFLLYLFPFPISHIPAIPIGQAYAEVWQAIVVLVGKHILHISQPIAGFDSDAGDSLYSYLHVLVLGAVSVLIMAVWSFFDRNRTAYPVLLHWLRVWLRYYLATMMVFYGVSKVLHLQMAPPTLYELVQPLGEKNPMALAWSYVGLSEAFSVFTGLAEILSGVLLFFRRTTTIGALLVATIMLNVLVMNLAFNIPVKLYSSLLLLMALFLVLHDGKRLMHVLVWNKPTEPKPFSTYIHSQWGRVVALAFKILFIGWVFVGNATSGYARMHKHGKMQAHAPIYGIYDTEHFVLKGDTVAPLSTAPRRWKQLITEFPDHIHIRHMNDSVTYYPVYWDARQQKMVVSPGDPKNRAELVYDKQLDVLTLSGTLGRDSISITLQERDLKSFPLINTPFRWIQEY